MTANIPPNIRFPVAPPGSGECTKILSRSDTEYPETDCIVVRDVVTVVNVLVVIVVVKMVVVVSVVLPVMVVTVVVLIWLSKIGAIVARSVVSSVSPFMSTVGPTYSPCLLQNSNGVNDFAFGTENASAAGASSSGNLGVIATTWPRSSKTYMKLTKCTTLGLPLATIG